MRYSVLLDRLQNLINYKPSQSEIGKILDLRQTAISGRANRDSNFSDDEIKKIEQYYHIVIEDDNLTIDYYPDVFGSCGNGVFELSPEKTQIIKDYKQAKANNKAMLKAAKQNQKDLEFAKQNAWQVPEGFFENIRSQITKNPTSVKMQGLRKEDLLLEE